MNLIVIEGSIIPSGQMDLEQVLEPIGVGSFGFVAVFKEQLGS